MLQCRPRVARSLASIAFALCLTACGPPLLAPGQSENGELRPEETATYRFELQKGELLYLTVDQIELDAVLNLYDPEGKLIGDEVDTFFDGVSEDIYYLAEKSGTHTVEVGRFSTQNGRSTPLRFSINFQTSPADEHAAQIAEAFWTFTRGINRAHNSGDCRGAVSGLSEAVTQWRKLENPKFFAISANGLAKCQRNLGSLKKSSETLHAALTMPFIDDAHHSRATLLQILSETEARQGLFKNAGENATEALRLFQLTGDLNRQSSTLMSLCSQKYAMGLNEESAKHCQATLEIASMRADTALMSRATIGLSAALRADGHYQEAIRVAREALDISPENSNDRALACTSLARALMASGRPEEAVGYFEKAAEIYSRVDSLGQLASAKISLTRALLVLGESDRALEVIQEVLSWRGHFDNQLKIAQALEVRARVFDVLGRLDDARDNVEEAFTLIESIRPNTPDLRSRATLLGTRWRIYELRVDLAMKLGGDEGSREGFRAAEQARARTLIDTLHQPFERDPIGKADLALSVRDIQNQLLSEETAILQFFFGSKQSYSWLITNEAVRSAILPPKDQLNAKAQELIASVKDAYASGKAVTDPSKPALELAELLELTDTLSEMDGLNLVVVPDGNLHMLPFSMLPIGQREKAEFLIDRFVVTHALSATALATQRRVAAGSSANGRLAILADPVFRADDERLKSRTTGLCNAPLDLQRLPQTNEEAEAIAALARPHGQVFKGFQATKGLLMSGELSEYQYLHVATHGVVDPEEPDRASLVMACFDEAGHSLDSQVTLYDLEKVRLNADLVVLSACRTAQGEHVFGEGLMGLTRGFMSAGVPRVVSSFWTVQDSVTRELMQDFYARMLVEKKTPAVALHEAQIELRKYRPEPYHWAAFVLHGEWQ